MCLIGVSLMLSWAFVIHHSHYAVDIAAIHKHWKASVWQKGYEPGSLKCSHSAEKRLEKFCGRSSLFYQRNFVSTGLAWACALAKSATSSLMYLFSTSRVECPMSRLRVTKSTPLRYMVTQKARRKSCSPGSGSPTASARLRTIWRKPLKVNLPSRSLIKSGSNGRLYSPRVFR